MSIAARMRRAASGLQIPEPEPGGDGLISTLGTIEFQSSFNGGMGWEFEVGGSDLTAVGLRIYMPSVRSTTAYLWRVSDRELLQSAGLDAVADDWAEVSITSTVLSASTNYIVSVDIGGSSYYRSDSPPTGFAFNGVSYVTGRFTSSTATFPSSSAGRIYGIADVLIST